MIRLLWRLFVLVMIAAGFAWLADRPGKINITWLGRDIELSVLVALVTLLIAFVLLAWAYLTLRRLWRTPQTAREFWKFRRTQKAYGALSKGIIAANAGDAQAAAKQAAIASATLTDEPLLDVLNAQAAQLSGDREAVRKAFEEMTKNPATEVLGLRGLFTEAKQTGNLAAAIEYAEKALKINPRLAWASSAALQIQTTRKDWQAAAATIAAQGKSGLLGRADADQKRAALLAADALAIEDKDRDRALTLAETAHGFDSGLVPAALVAARCHIANGATKKALRIIRDCWAKAPHADLARLAAHAKPGDGPEERYERVRDLVGEAPVEVEGAFGLAQAALEAKRYDAARMIIMNVAGEYPQQRFCALLAQIEEALGDRGRARGWLAKALNAPRDPMWVSDGVAAPRWTAVSPVTGEIIRCEWKAPYDVDASLAAALQSPEKTTENATAAVSFPSSLPNRKLETVVLQRLPDDPGVSDET